MPERQTPKGPPRHQHPSIQCYRKHGCRCDPEHPGEKHLGWEECLKATTTWNREHRQKTSKLRGTPAATRRREPLSEDEVMRLRRQVGLI